ncbi:uncharacterized protein B0H18DRAFT_955911 [Fomitopsis serialis]|uniref:uncharacterized protein n=1 Tax=Fomitopsis serialis TaxID=139415 RepID=UPI002007E016|nr:uncharacterized protein B0H18DRAFT_955911 [Neoantrodia serialis]KAH9923373.1 hypothetical protein B0H18DRAFT_955911 [Neoantrodia serialis]
MRGDTHVWMWTCSCTIQLSEQSTNEGVRTRVKGGQTYWRTSQQTRQKSNERAEDQRASGRKGDKWVDRHKSRWTGTRAGGQAQEPVDRHKSLWTGTRAGGQAQEWAGEHKRCKQVIGQKRGRLRAVRRAIIVQCMPTGLMLPVVIVSVQRSLVSWIAGAVCGVNVTSRARTFAGREVPSS